MGLGSLFHGANRSLRLAALGLNEIRWTADRLHTLSPSISFQLALRVACLRRVLQLQIAVRRSSLR